MGFGAYLKSHLWDYVFCLMAAAALSYTLFSGFYATQPLQSWPGILVPLGCCALTVALLIAVAYNARTALVGGAALALVLVGAVMALGAVSPGSTPVEDVEGNYVIAALVVSGSCVLSFLLSRTYAGSAALLVAVVGACALIEYLYWYGHLVALAVGFAGALGLVVLKGYERRLVGSDADDLAFFSVGVLALVLAAVALLVGLCVYKLVVEPLDPPRAQVMLVVEHRRAEEVDIVGTGAASADTSGDSGNEANGDQEETDREADDVERDTLSGGIMSLLGIDDDQTGDAGTTSALEKVVVLAAFALLLVALLVAVVIAIRKALRKRRFGKMTSGSNEEAARNLYLFFLDRFAKMKLARPDNLSLKDYCAGFASRFAEFERFKPASGVGFEQLTEAYIGVMYGHEAVDDAQLAAFSDYYRTFYKNARRFVGRVRYVGKFFTL